VKGTVPFTEGKETTDIPSQDNRPTDGVRTGFLYIQVT